ncbi:MAG: hypothetical protein M0P61_14945, partial [Ignavibacteriaceae bacterium]|nr:hypothetical protein [Ignavibacteriaceae bacterium]
SMKLFISILLITFAFSGCGKKEKVYKFNNKGIEYLISEAANGNKTANDSLSNLFDLNLPPQSVINKIEIDSIKNNSGKTFYGIIVEFPNPFFNRFAVYDSSMQCYLIDKSLNGYLSLTSIKTEKKNFFQVFEQFTSKDVLSLKRKNLYLVKGDTVNLALRFYTQFFSPSDHLIQEVETFTDELVQAKILSEKGLSPQQSWDTFSFDEHSLKFKSQNNYFETFVLQLTNQFAGKPVMPFFNDQSSALKGSGKKFSVDSAQTYNNYNNKMEKYSLYLPEGWKPIFGVSFKDVLNTKVEGTKFINVSLGASFGVIKLKANGKAEDHLSFTLKNKVDGNYTVRFSEKNLINRNYYLCFEISCYTLKFLVVFQCPEILYEANKQTFESIINSFWIDC